MYGEDRNGRNVHENGQKRARSVPGRGDARSQPGMTEDEPGMTEDGTGREMDGQSETGARVIETKETERLVL